jgi:hypothetical protein
MLQNDYKRLGHSGVLGMLTMSIWKCPCIKHLEKRHPYWYEKKSRPILALANMGLDMEMIWCSNSIANYFPGV